MGTLFYIAQIQEGDFGKLEFGAESSESLHWIDLLQVQTYLFHYGHELRYDDTYEPHPEFGDPEMTIEQALTMEPWDYYTVDATQESGFDVYFHEVTISGGRITPDWSGSFVKTFATYEKAKSWIKRQKNHTDHELD